MRSTTSGQQPRTYLSGPSIAKACLAALAGDLTLKDVRTAFAAAAKEVGMLLD